MKKILYLFLLIYVGVNGQGLTPVNVGTSPGAGNGDLLRTAFMKLNHSDSVLLGYFTSLSDLLYYNQLTKTLSPYTSRQPGKLYNHNNNPNSTLYSLKYDGNFYATWLYSSGLINTGQLTTGNIVFGDDGEYQASTITTSRNNFIFYQPVYKETNSAPDSAFITIGHTKTLISRVGGSGADSTKMKSNYQARLDSIKLSNRISFLMPKNISYTTSIPFDYQLNDLGLHTIVGNETLTINSTGAVDNGGCQVLMVNNTSYTLNLTAFHVLGTYDNTSTYTLLTFIRKGGLYLVSILNFN